MLSQCFVVLEHKYLEPPFIILAPWFIGYYYCTTSFSKVWTMVPRRFKYCLRRVGGLLWRELMTVVPAGNNTKRFLLVNHSAKQFIVHNLLPLQPLPLGSFYLCAVQYEWVKFIFVKAIGHLSSIFWNAETWMLYFILGKIKYDVIRNVFKLLPDPTLLLKKAMNWKHWFQTITSWIVKWKHGFARWALAHASASQPFAASDRKARKEITAQS